MPNKSSVFEVSTKAGISLVIGPAGNCLAIYDDALAFDRLGQIAITRASHVEPDQAGNWWADLAPVGGPRLGPHRRRSDALAAERTWLGCNLPLLETRATAASVEQSR
jgi:hypothetical protein